MSVSSAVVVLTPQDLVKEGGVFCPSPRAHMALWNSHPRVYLPLNKEGKAQCPYCGTRYQLNYNEVAAEPSLATQGQKETL